MSWGLWREHGSQVGSTTEAGVLCVEHWLYGDLSSAKSVKYILSCAACLWFSTNDPNLRGNNIGKPILILFNSYKMMPLMDALLCSVTIACCTPPGAPSLARHGMLNLRGGGEEDAFESLLRHDPLRDNDELFSISFKVRVP